MPSYRMKCQNLKCGAEHHKHYKSKEEFEKDQYPNGIGCFRCSYPKMVIMRSLRVAKDSFVPGFQRNIMMHFDDYGAYKKELKRRGLIEIGYEDLEDIEETRTKYWDDNLLKKINNQYGLQLSGREADALKDGLI